MLVCPGPVISIPTSLAQNRDTFTGKEIYDEEGTTKEKFFQVANYLWNANVPGFLAGMLDMTDTSDYNLTNLQGATRKLLGLLERKQIVKGTRAELLDKRPLDLLE